MLLYFALLMLALSGNNQVSCQDEEAELIKGRFALSFPYCSLGEDKDGAAVYFIPFARWKMGASATNPTTKEKQVLQSISELVFRTIKTEAGRRKTGVTYIVDAAGVDIPGLLSPPIIQLSKRTLADNEEFTRAMGRLFIVNLAVPSEELEPFWDTFGELWSRTQVYGTDRNEWEPELLRRVPKNILLEGYGGKNPVPENCERKEIKRKDEEAAQIKARFALAFPYCSLGEDKDGAAVYLLPFARWQMGESATNPTPKEKQVLQSISELVFRTIKSEAGRRKKGVTYIVDAAGVDIPHLLSPPIIQLSKRTLADNEEFTRAMGSLLIVNLPVPSEELEPFWDTLGELWSRTQVYGTDRNEWEPALLRRVPKNVLLQGYGGTSPVPETCERSAKKQKPKALKSILGGLLG